MLRSLHWKRAKKILVPLGVATVGMAVVQGARIRLNYINSDKLEPPTGPANGLEMWADKIKEFKDSLMDSVHSVPDGKTLSDKLRKIKDVFELQPDAEVAKYNKAAVPIYTTKQTIVETAIDDEIDKEIRDSALQDKLRDNNPCIPLQHSPISGKRVKLLVMGDSLVSGVGCELLHSSPVLPKVLAKMLSFALQADVEWYSAGIVGATVKDLRNKVLPAVREKLLLEMKECTTSTNDRKESKHSKTKGGLFKLEEADGEIIVVVICGLNDWKTLFEKFPRGLGPGRFRKELSELVHEIKDMSIEIGIPCRIFLPKLPLSCLASDPNCSFNVAPLSYFVWYLCYLWDIQKQAIAVDDDQVSAPPLKFAFNNYYYNVH